MKVLMLKGLPASGKSTYAKELVSKNHNWVRVNKDDLRAMMNNGEFSYKLEKQIVKTERELVDIALKNGKSVVIDDTNFNLDHELFFSLNNYILIVTILSFYQIMNKGFIEIVVRDLSL